jgi:hypothetical protein
MKKLKSKNKNDFIRICPKCNSDDIVQDFSNAGMIGSGMIQNSYVCNNCGNTGTFFPEVRKDKIPAVKNKKDIKNINLVNKQMYSNIIWWWKIFGPVLIILSIISLFIKIPFLFYGSLFEFIPASIIITINSYTELYKNKIWKIISFIAIIYLFTLGPILAGYFSSLTNI